MSDLEDRVARDTVKVTKLAEAKRAAKPKPPPAFVALDIRNFATAELPQTQCVVEGLLPRKHVSLLGAHGGAGKSILALTLAAHIACGDVWAGLDVQQGRAVVVSLEDSGDIARVRLKRIAHAYNLDTEAIERELLVLDGSGGNGILAAETALGGTRVFGETAALTELREHAKGATLIVVDNASDAFDGNENDRRNVRAFMRLLAQLAKDNDAAVLLLAHVDKQSAKFGANGNTYSGSTAWHNSARSRLALVDTDGAIELRHEKYNLGRLADAVRLAWDVNGVLIPGIAGNSGLTERDEADDESVFAALKAAVAASTNVPTARTGPSTTQMVLSTFPELSDALRKKENNQRFWAAIGRLQKCGCVGSEEFSDTHRNRKTRFVVISNCVISGALVNPPYPLANKRTQGGVLIRVGSGQLRNDAEPTQTYATKEAEL